MHIKELLDLITITTTKLEEMHGGEFYPIITNRTVGIDIQIMWIRDKDKAIEKPELWCEGFVGDGYDSEAVENMVKFLLEEALSDER